MDGSSSEKVMLICEECGERTVVGDPLSVWLCGSPLFGCECDNHLTLADRLDRQKVEFGVSGP